MWNTLSSRALNVGSLNIDHVYNVTSFVQPGETISSLTYAKFAGGKGANQSVALARAGANVAHAGRIGADGVIYHGDNRDITVKAVDVDVVDTTAAGDTFIGYLIAAMVAGADDIKNALMKAVCAAEICVQSLGAIDSIPEWREMD